MSSLNCIAPDELRGFLDDTISFERREECEQHLSDCRHCRKLLLTLYSSSEHTVLYSAPLRLKQRVKNMPNRSGASVYWRFFDPRKLLVFGPAIVVLIAVGLYFYFQQYGITDRAIDQIFRNERSGTQEIRLIEPSGQKIIRDNVIQFQWSTVPDAKSYRLRLLSENGDVVFEASSEVNSYKLDASIIPLIPRKAYFWYVATSASDGHQIESSPSKLFYNPR